MSSAPLAPQFLRDPQEWVSVPGCVCRSAGVGFVHDVNSEPVVYAAGTGGALPGLTAEETAILAGVLTGLAMFLFLLLPILCCLCPLPCACCGKKKGAVIGGHRHDNVARNGSDESFWSTGSWGGGGGGDKMAYENLYGVDMKLPRPWVDSDGDHFDSRARELEREGEWEGVDMTREEVDAARAGRGGGEDVAQTAVVTYAGGEQQGGSTPNGGTMYSTVDRRHGAAGGGGDEVVTEYATTRRLDIQFGGMNQDDAEGYYTSHYGQNPEADMSKDNFMKLYWAYRNQADA